MRKQSKNIDLSPTFLPVFIRKPLSTPDSCKEPELNSLLCILTEHLHFTSQASGSWSVKLECYTRWSQNSSRLWVYKIKCWLGFTFIEFIRLNAGWVLPSAALRNWQYSMVWDVRVSVFPNPFEQISNK